MKTFESGSTVQGGYYWNLGKWEMATVQGEAGKLDGKPGDRYVKVALPLVFVAAPLMGGLFVMFLPFIGFALAANAAAKAGAKATKDLGAELASVMTPGWRPGEAHMQGKRPDEKADAKAPAAADGLDKLQKEIDEKRAEKK
jgi:hypothetical protein